MAISKKDKILMNMAIAGMEATSMTKADFDGFILDESDIEMLNAIKAAIDSLILESKLNKITNYLHKMVKEFETES